MGTHLRGHTGVPVLQLPARGQSALCEQPWGEIQDQTAAAPASST